jgi:hypothetical protein
MKGDTSSNIFLSSLHGAITYQYDLRGNITSVPPSRARNIAAIMNISPLGKIELYKGIGNDKFYLVVDDIRTH